jgi:hypothetical protein
MLSDRGTETHIGASMAETTPRSTTERSIRAVLGRRKLVVAPIGAHPGRMERVVLYISCSGACLFGKPVPTFPEHALKDQAMAGEAEL